MTNSAIRLQQRENSKKLDEDGKLLIRQRNFPKLTTIKSIVYKTEREQERRKAQIKKGQLRYENGLI